MSKELDVSDASKYQQISYDGKILKPGWRRQEPCSLIDWKGMEGKSVLDLACNNGMMSIQAKQAGADRVVGVDYSNHIHFARRVRDHLDLDIEFWHADLRSIEFMHWCPQFDVVLCCSVFRYMPEKLRFLTFLDRITKKVMYLETNHKDAAEPIFEQIKLHTTFSAKVLGHADLVSAEKAVGHFMIRCRKETQWKDWPITMLPVDLLKLTHDLEGYKNERYPSDTYDRRVMEVTRLADDIEKYGLKTPIWTREFLSGPSKGMFRVVEGHTRSFALKMLKDRGRLYDVPCKTFPYVGLKWIRQHGHHFDDYMEIFEEEKRTLTEMNNA